MRVASKLIVAVFSAAAANAAFSAEYYVAKSGKDSNPGTEERPWATISKANDVLQAGDTVYIRGGEYSQVLKPRRSGTEGKYITYRAYPSETPVLTNISANDRTAIVLDGRSYIRIDGIKVTGKATGSSANLNTWISMNNAHYNVIQKSEFKYAAGWNGIVLDGGSRHNKFLNNRMDNVGTWADGKGDMISVKCANFNLIQGNHLSKAGHNLLDVAGSYNVVRNNIFDNKWGDGKGYRNLDLSGNYKFCGEGPNGYTLFENNVIRNTLPNGRKSTTAAMKVQGTNQIVRRNLIVDNSGPAITTVIRDSYNIRRSWKNKIFHNVFYNNDSIWEARDYSNTRPLHSNVFKNNAFLNIKSSTVSFADIATSGAAAGFDALANTQFVGNTFGYSGTSMTANFIGVGDRPISWYQRNKSANFKGNIFEDADFVARPRKLEDVRLNDGSALIDRGEMLTYTASDGSGTAVQVHDAGYFSDGFQVIEGDRVQIGGNQAVEVTRVDYGKNILHLRSAVSWKKGDGVSLPYHGAAPDIGAQEHGGAGLVPPAPPKNVYIEVIAK